jgi:hypothetical protein
MDNFFRAFFVSMPPERVEPATLRFVRVGGKYGNHMKATKCYQTSRDCLTVR